MASNPDKVSRIEFLLTVLVLYSVFGFYVFTTIFAFLLPILVFNNNPVQLMLGWMITYVILFVLNIVCFAAYQSYKNMEK